MSYQPPPVTVCEELECPVPLDDAGRHRVVWRQVIYRGKVVDFSIEQQYRPSQEAAWERVYRADTSHGEVHDHVFLRDGSEKRRLHAVIPIKGWDFVDEWFESLLGSSLSHAEDRLRRWLSG